MTGLQLTVRLFAFTDRSGFAVPRRGAVKVWSTAVERMVVQCLAPVVTGAGARPGLTELRLDLSPDGRLTAARVETGSGAVGTDTALTSGLMAGNRFPALPPALEAADFLLLVECVPVPEVVDSLA